MNFQEILAKLNEKEITWEDLGNEDVNWGTLEPEVGKVKIVHSYGGEGQGDDIGVVYYFKDHDVYMEVFGHYASHYGTDWNHSPIEVKPQQETITVYKQVK